MMDPQALSAAERLVDHTMMMMMALDECYCDEGPGGVMHDILKVSAYILTIWAADVEGTRLRVPRN